MEPKHIVILMSGGIDSTATIVVCQGTDARVSGVFIDYGQPAAKSEWQAARDVADHYHLKVRKLDIGITLLSNRGEFFGRNALMILAAAGTVDSRPLIIATGIHALTEYYDTTPLFVKHIQRILNGYSGGTVTLNTPFLTQTKSDVIQFAKNSAIPFSLTYSCELQNAPSCGRCPSCLDRSDAIEG